jgi:hypothetical protein
MKTTNLIAVKQMFRLVVRRAKKFSNIQDSPFSRRAILELDTDPESLPSYFPPA